MTKQGRLINLINEIFAKYPSGGALHIILDDGNTEDHHIRWCIDHLNEYAEKEDVEMFSECARLLLSMSERERDEAISYYEKHTGR